MRYPKRAMRYPSRFKIEICKKRPGDDGHTVIWSKSVGPDNLAKAVDRTWVLRNNAEVKAKWVVKNNADLVKAKIVGTNPVTQYWIKIGGNNLNESDYLELLLTRDHIIFDLPLRQFGEFPERDFAHTVIQRTLPPYTKTK